MFEDLKLMLGIDPEDRTLDERLEWIIESVTARLTLLLGGIEPPESMNHIITEVSIVRFNRVGSEGVKAQSVEGESNTYQDGDFDGYANEIQAFLDQQEESARGKVRFL